MRRYYNYGSMRKRISNRRQCGQDTCVFDDFTGKEWNVEIHSYEESPTFKVEVFDGSLIHVGSKKYQRVSEFPEVFT